MLSAYGADIFLGPGESETDVALMAHELAHVAQQRGGGAVAPQRKIAVGEAGNPAEADADRVASDVVSVHHDDDNGWLIEIVTHAPDGTVTARQDA